MMLSVPTPANDPINMSDWLELRALLVDDGSASGADLRRVLVATGADPNDESPGVDEGEAEEIHTSDAFAELEDRAAACPDCYPFVVEGSQLRVRGDDNPCWGYVFCLLLSYQGADRGEAPRSITELFEEVSEIAARSYVSGTSRKWVFRESGG
ncbi:MAG: hypothetical protein ACREF4_06355 [Gammaproteobacteria bacterium]